MLMAVDKERGHVVEAAVPRAAAPPRLVVHHRHVADALKEQRAQVGDPRREGAHVGDEDLRLHHALQVGALLVVGAPLGRRRREGGEERAQVGHLG